MIRIRRIAILASICCGASVAFSQNNQQQDSLKVDSANASTESLLLKHQLDKQVDSLVLEKLKEDLYQAGGDRRKTNELTEKLAQITARDSIRKANELEKIEKLRKDAVGYPVAPFNDTLFFIYTRFGSLKAEERAGSISARIRRLYEDPFFDGDSLKINDNEVSMDIMYKNEMVICSVTRLDALWFDRDAKSIAEEYLGRIRKEVASEKKENSLSNWLKQDWPGFVDYPWFRLPDSFNQ